ncbi:hypothetical protein WDU94_002181 [Cyamophila willieti]
MIYNNRKITSVTPDKIARSKKNTTLDIAIENLPELPALFICEITIGVSTLAAKTTEKTDVSVDRLPSIPPGQHYIPAKLFLRGLNFVPTIIHFFDCNTFSSCAECISSEFSCNWCVNQHRCSHSIDCPNDILIMGMRTMSRTGQILKNDLTFCPTINGTNTSSREILVAFNSEKSVNVKVHILDQSIAKSQFVCTFNIEDRKKNVSAKLVGDTIYCNSMCFNYTSRMSSIIVPLSVEWGSFNPKTLDNPDNVHLNIYRCWDLADSCGLCLTLNEKYKCGWCQSSHRCEIFEQCDQRSFLNRTQDCPDPKITSFHPKSGPLEGGTNITINGMNLGKTYEDIADGVTVAGMKCHPFKSLYNCSTQIVCQVEGPGKVGVQGLVDVKIGVFLGQSTDNYQFLDPNIWSINPLYGPRSGGTILNIYGSHMNVASNTEVFIDDLPCSIISVSPDVICCNTRASDTLREGNITINFDKGTRYFKGYTYVEDPTIESVGSGFDEGKMHPKGTPAGGTTINVVGKNFLCIKKPLFYVVYQGNRFSEACHVMSNETMNCTAPSINVKYPGKNNDTHPEQLEYGFMMDNVASVQNLSSKLNNLYLLYPNPIYYQFKEEIEHYKNENLTIYGEYLDNNGKFLESEVVVMVGIELCNKTSLSKSQLTIKLPSEQPLNSTDDTEDVLPLVRVIVGKNLNFDIGKLSYSTEISLLTIALYVGTAVLILLTFICLVISFLYHQESSENRENTRIIKQMEKQMDILESRVAKECKEAFTELQTEISDLIGDLTTGGIPFWNYREYALKVLFPDGENYLQFGRPDLLVKEKGLSLFNDLLMKETFLLLFIRTLESNRCFSMRDRVNVSSLIMVALKRHMKYCTDILKILLSDLIVKNTIKGKSNPKLVLRRTECIAEKMLSSWFTLLLHKFLYECAGKPLYMLFLAIKQQVNKGPIDVFTGEARYSLSEDKMIRHVFDYKPMTLKVRHNNEDYVVKVLDCDSISQVKEKSLDTIDYTKPYSQRCKKDDHDLKWQTGNTGSLTLNDNDMTNQNDGEWRKVNTLNHYRVPDGGRFSLVVRERNSSILRNTPLNQSTMKINTTDPDKDLEREWHLVKQHDNENQKKAERSNKLVSEVYLTRLLTTKGTLQNYVDDLFKIIFSTESPSLFAIKYMFDFLDKQAADHDITDPKIVHTWKSNALPLRFWVNLIKNPNFLFDIHKSNTVDSCLSVVAQAFMDSCGTSEHRLGKDSPSSKLLYAKDIPAYKEWVGRYYSDIKSMPAISDQDMNAMLAEESRLHSSESEFNMNIINCALYELYTYAFKYNEQLTVTLEEDESARKENLSFELQDIIRIMS